MINKCAKCPDRFHPDGYICDNECPFNEDGTPKASPYDSWVKEKEEEYYREQEENSRTPQ